MRMGGEREGACSIARNWQLTEPFGRRANAACDYAAGEKAGAAGVALPAGQIDGPSMMMLDLTRAQPPAGMSRATHAPSIHATGAPKPLPAPTRIAPAVRVPA